MYVEHATQGRSRPVGPPARAPARVGQHHAERIGNMKRWAAEQGLDYPKRGRLPKSLVEAYDAAH